MVPRSMREQDEPKASAAEAEKRLKNLRREIPSIPSERPYSSRIRNRICSTSFESFTTPLCDQCRSAPCQSSVAGIAILRAFRDFRISRERIVWTSMTPQTVSHAHGHILIYHLHR